MKSLRCVLRKVTAWKAVGDNQWDFLQMSRYLSYIMKTTHSEKNKGKEGGEGKRGGWDAEGESDDAEINKEENAKRGLGRNWVFQRLARFRATCEDWEAQFWRHILHNHKLRLYQMEVLKAHGNFKKAFITILLRPSSAGQPFLTEALISPFHAWWSQPCTL